LQLLFAEDCTIYEVVVDLKLDSFGVVGEDGKEPIRLILILLCSGTRFD